MSDIYAAFSSVDMRVGCIVEAELNSKARVPAYKMLIDFGPEIGTKKCSGQYPANYLPEKLIGRQVVCAMNLGTRRIAGYESEVLMLGAPDEVRNAIFLTTERNVPLGSRVF